LSYSLSALKVAAYNFTEPPDMTWEERMLWMGLAYCYECFRAGEDKQICDELAQTYIRLFCKGGKE